MASNLPPGVTNRMIEAQFADAQCDTCGMVPDDCHCPPCPKCGEIGNPYCYEQGHLHYNKAQLQGQTRMRISALRDQIADEEQYLAWLETATEEDVK